MEPRACFCPEVEKHPDRDSSYAERDLTQLAYATF